MHIDLTVDPNIWWYLSRAAAIVGWFMLTASVLWGIVLATDLFPKKRKAAWLLDLHRALAGLTFFFVAAHLGMLTLDSHAHIGLRAMTIPFATTWRPTAVTLGVAGAYLLIAIELTALARKHLSKIWWRDIHFASYLVFWSVSIHSALAGTDASRPLYTIPSVVVLAATVFAVTYRILSRDLPKRRPARAAKQAAAAVRSV